MNRGLLVPKGTPAAVLAKLESACAAAAKEPAFAAGDEAAGHRRALPRTRTTTRKWLKKNDELNHDLTNDLGLLKR